MLKTTWKRPSSHGSRCRFVRTICFALCSAALLFAAATQIDAQSVPTRHVRQEVLTGQARLLNRLPDTRTLRLHIVLPLRDQAGLDELLKEIADPASPNYRHYLSVSEFTARFAPVEADYETAARYFAANGLAVVGGSRDGMDLQVEGPVSAIEEALHVSMGVYQHPAENRTFYSPDREPTLPFSVWHISGLDNFSIPHPLLVNRSDYAQAHGIAPDALVSHATTGSGPSASFLGSDMRAAYYGGTALTGAGQNLGLFEFAGTDLVDLDTYYSNVGQTNNVPITLLSVDGTSTSCVYSRAGGRCDDGEQTLDMTQALGMAPGLASLVMYIGSSDTAIVSAMTTHSPLPMTVSCSWGFTPADPSELNPYLQKMAAQGQSFFTASGDDSTWTAKGNAEAWPADNAWVISVGGTDLTTAGAGGPWASETAWSYSGGGISPDGVAIPSWQQMGGVITSANGGSTTLRNGPDVSANANFTFYLCADQTTCTANEYGGTSFAAPTWAGYAALANEQAGASGKPPVGFINPAVYSLGLASGYAAAMHDITSGTSGSYSALAGYDLVTGWGSPNGAGLINALTSAPATPDFSVSASPASVSVGQGSSGTSTITTSALGGFSSAISLTASGQPSGVTVSFSPSSIAAPGSGASTMTIAVASNVAAGSYMITVAAAGGNTSHTATVTVIVTAPSSFTLSASPASLTVVPRRGTASTIVTATLSGGFDSTITVSVSGLPRGVNLTFSQAGSLSLRLTFSANQSAPAGTYPLTVTGSGGGITQTTTISLTVE